MTDILDARADLLNYADSLQKRYELSKTVDDEYFEPGMMENLDQYQGTYNDEYNKIVLKTEVKGLRYENRTQKLDTMQKGDPVLILRDETNQFNPNNFSVNKTDHDNIGNLPADLCNALAPLVDMGYAYISNAEVSYIEKLADRSRYAKQGILFIQIVICLQGI